MFKLWSATAPGLGIGCGLHHSKHATQADCLERIKAKIKKMGDTCAKLQMNHCRQPWQARRSIDWMTWDMDENSGVHQPPDRHERDHLARQKNDRGLHKMVDIPKVVFSKTLHYIDGQNARAENGDMTEAVNQLKRVPGKDIVVYGGATFVSSLIENGLIDELNFFVNPVAIGNGMRVFKDRRPMKLTASLAYPCGIVVNSYEPK
jgi:dihydrofolate reductase